MADSPSLARLRSGHYNSADWNGATNPGGMGGDGHRQALVPPKAPQMPAYPVLLNDLVTLADEMEVSAAAAAASGAATVTLSGAVALTSAAPRVQNLNPNGASRDVTLPDATSFAHAGGPLFIIRNAAVEGGSIHVLVLKNAAGTGLRYLYPGDTAFVCLLDRSSAAGVWDLVVVERPAGGITAIASMNADLTLSPGVFRGRIVHLVPQDSGRSVTLPSGLEVDFVGGPLYHIRNASAVNPLMIKANGGALLTTLRPFQTAIVSCTNRGSAAGTWAIDVIANDPYDGNAVTNLPADFNLSSRTSRSLSFTPIVPGRVVYLPDATTMPYTGGPIFNITNASTSLSFQIRGSTGTLLDEVQPGQTVLVWLRDKSSAAGTWSLMAADRPSGTAFSPRQMLDTTFLHNHQISPTSRADKALWSYSRNGTLCVRVLTITGQTVTPGAEHLLGPGPQGGMALALTDTYGVACWATEADTFHRGFTIDLSTGVCTLTGSAVGWGMSSSERDIRMCRVPGSSTHCLAMSRNADMHARLISFNGTSLTQSPVLVTTGTSTNFGCHDVLALNSSWAAIFLADAANSGRFSYRQLTMDTAAMTLANGGTIQLAAEGASQIVCARVSSGVGNYFLTMSSSGPDLGACLRHSGDNATGRYVLSPNWGGAGSSGRPGACIVWPGTTALTAFFTLFNLAANAHRAVIQDLTWDITRNNGNTWENNAFRPAGPPRNISAIPGAAVNAVSHEHWSAGAALSSTTGLFIYSDATNGNYPTAVLVERIA